MKWVSLLGEFVHDNNAILFRGGKAETAEGELHAAVGNLLSDARFGEGEISANIEFVNSVEGQGCELILYYHPQGQTFVTAGIAAQGPLCHVRSFSNLYPQLNAVYGAAGDRQQLQAAKRSYDLMVRVRGSQVSVLVDGVAILVAELPIPLPRGQAGLWCMGTQPIRITGYEVSRTTPRAFILMEFSESFNEFHEEVVKPICSDLGLEAVRADDSYGPGLIIADIVRQITESKIVIAEVTTANPNVYYELGYAHAMRKPTILIAERATRLPFDVAPFRTLFYENTIRGKGRVEEGLRRHLEAVQAEWSGGR